MSLDIYERAKGLLKLKSTDWPCSCNGELMHELCETVVKQADTIKGLMLKSPVIIPAAPREDFEKQFISLLDEYHTIQRELYELKKRKRCTCDEAELIATTMRALSTNHPGDPEATHRAMDNFMCRLLSGYGLGDAVDIFKSTEKWYS